MLGLPVLSVGPTVGVFGGVADSVASTLTGNFTDAVSRGVLSGVGQVNVGSFITAVGKETVRDVALSQLNQTGLPLAYGVASQSLAFARDVHGAFSDVLTPPRPVYVPRPTAPAASSEGEYDPATGLTRIPDSPDAVYLSPQRSIWAESTNFGVSDAFYTQDPSVTAYHVSPAGKPRGIFRKPVDGTLTKYHWHHNAVKSELFARGLIDADGNTTKKVLGGRTNIHGKEWGHMLPEAEHLRIEADGVHTKDANGLTYEDHFRNELESRIRDDGNIEYKELRNATDATKKKYSRQYAAGFPATDDWDKGKQAAWRKDMTNRSKGIVAKSGGALSVYGIVRDVGGFLGFHHLDYQAENNTAFFKDKSGAVFTIREKGWFSNASKTYLTGDRAGKTFDIPQSDFQQFQQQIDNEFGKFVPGSWGREPKFIPGTEPGSRQFLPLYRYDSFKGTNVLDGVIDKNGINRFDSPRTLLSPFQGA